LTPIVAGWMGKTGNKGEEEEEDGEGGEEKWVLERERKY
jgi:hypothetical protein